MSMDLLFKEEYYNIVGAAMEVHRVLGRSFGEKIYQDALEVEFQRQNIPYLREKHVAVKYKGVTLQHDFFADFVCYDKIIVELKAVTDFAAEHYSQVIDYLSATGMHLGILLNFGASSLKHKRVVKTLGGRFEY